MSVTVSPQRGIVLRAQYERIRTLLVIAMIAVVGLTYAVVELANTKATSALQRHSLALDHFDLNQHYADEIADAETGARLDHRGEK